MSADPYYLKCARENAVCAGRITWEHAIIWAGKQVNEVWAIIPLCHYHHQGGGLDKDKNRYLALKRATDADLAKYPKRNWKQELEYLKQKYDNRDSTQS
jgi:hypothetical protein